MVLLLQRFVVEQKLQVLHRTRAIAAAAGCRHTGLVRAAPDGMPALASGVHALVEGRRIVELQPVGHAAAEDGERGFGVAFGQCLLDGPQVQRHAGPELQAVALGCQRVAGPAFAQAGKLAPQVAARGGFVECGPQQVAQPLSRRDAFQCKPDQQGLRFLDGQAERDAVAPQHQRPQDVQRQHASIMPSSASTATLASARDHGFACTAFDAACLAGPTRRWRSLGGVNRSTLTMMARRPVPESFGRGRFPQPLAPRRLSSLRSAH